MAGLLPVVADTRAGCDDEERVDRGHDRGQDHCDEDPCEERGEEFERSMREDFVVETSEVFGGEDCTAEESDQYSTGVCEEGPCERGDGAGEDLLGVLHRDVADEDLRRSEEPDPDGGESDDGDDG